MRSNDLNEIREMAQAWPRDAAEYAERITALCDEVYAMRKVVESAEAWDAEWAMAYHVQEKMDAESALHEAVRALRRVRERGAG